MGLSLNDKATLMIGETLSMDDQNVLALLYQPILGSKCYGIYMALFSLLNRAANNRVNIIHSNIADLTGVSIKDFEKERKKLEAIGLLNSYHRDNEYVYLMKAPLSARQFFKDGVMGIYLFDCVGEKLFNDLVKIFQVDKFNREGYSNVTESFDNVFKNKVADITINTDGYFIDKKQNQSAKIGSIDFDFDFFLKDLSLSVLEKQNLDTDFEDTIIKTAYCYDLSEKEMQQIYYRSLVDGEISYVKLTKEAKLLNKYKKQAKASETGIDILKVVKPDEILKTLIEKPKRESFDVIKHVVEESPYDIEITNMIIFHAINKYSKTKDKGTCPEYGYFVKVIDSFLKSKVKTFDDAKSFVERQADYVPNEKENTPNVTFEHSAWAEEFRKMNKED